MGGRGSRSRGVAAWGMILARTRIDGARVHVDFHISSYFQM